MTSEPFWESLPGRGDRSSGENAAPAPKAQGDIDSQGIVQDLVTLEQSQG